MPREQSLVGIGIAVGQRAPRDLQRLPEVVCRGAVAYAVAVGRGLQEMAVVIGIVLGGQCARLRRVCRTADVAVTVGIYLLQPF